MLQSRIKAACCAASFIALTACTSGGANSPANTLVLLPVPAAAPVLTQTALPVLVQPAMFTASDTVTFSVPVTRDAFGKVTAVTGHGTLQAATTLTIMPAAAVGNPPASLAVAGGVAATVLPLSTIAGTTGAYTGTTAVAGETFDIYTRQASVLATVASPQAGLTYADFGDWQSHPVAVGASTVSLSHWAGGTQYTLAMPVVGTASYTGKSSGSVIAITGATATQYALSGNISLTADFAASTVAGNITNISAVNNTTGVAVAAGSFNNVALSGTISGNAFNGTATAGAAPVGVNPASITAGASGTVAGHFYGPAANEAAGVWGMSTSTVQAAGSFGAKQ
ncbi:MAG: transferrin-binding protein-like solute binding protein [Nitrosomonadales bacterium]|nr:transferrin-binding protein-like solute binding protein [Nitrosomonadales bacterium]